MEFGWSHIWKLYGWKELFSFKNRLFYFSISVILLLVLSCLMFNHLPNLTYNLIDKIVDIGLSILPTLLGFNLGAYALIVGFLSNKNLLNALTEQEDEKTKDGLQKISSVFAVNIIVQAFTLLNSFLLRLAMDFFPKLLFNKKTHDFFYSCTFTTIVNYIILSYISLLTLYSISLVIQNAINIFDFSQLFTYFSLKKDDTE